MRTWVILLGGLIVWFAHFLTLYAIGSVVGASDAGRTLVGIFTAFALAANALLLAVSLRLRRGGGSSSAAAGTLGALGAGLSVVAVIWQALPAAFA